MRLASLAASVALVLLSLAACGRVGEPPQAAADSASLDVAARLDAIDRLLADADYDRARAAIAAARADGVDHPRLPYLEALMLLSTGERADVEAAIPLLERAVAGRVSWLEPRLRLAEAHLRLDRLSSAERIYRDFDQLFPDSPFGPYGRGTIALRQGFNDQADELFAEALTRDPNFAPALRARAWLAELANDNPRRRRLLTAYVSLRPDDAAAWAQLGDSHHRAGFPEDARRAYERSYQLAPDPLVADKLAALARARQAAPPPAPAEADQPR